MYSFKEQPPILYFHSVAPQKRNNWSRSYLTFELKYFEDILRWITRKGLQSFFISELKDGDRYDIDSSLGLSFDDGYLDNYVYVFPLLKKYGIKATLFVSLDYVDPENKLRPTLEDVWNNKYETDDLETWGFCSVSELKKMQNSGFVDIQSHTVTHDKYPVSEKIVGFYHPGTQNINFYMHENPKIKPFYIKIDNLLKDVPYGYPLFEEKSAVLSPRVWINKEFTTEIVWNLKNFDWDNYNFEDAYNIVKAIVNKHRAKNTIIEQQESEDEYKKRVYDELNNSKEELKKMLNKEIDVLCWPHGDFNQICLDIARDIGYKKIHFVENKQRDVIPAKDLFVRIPVGNYKNSRVLTLLKTKSRVYQAMNKFPYIEFGRLYRFLKKLKPSCQIF